MEDKDLKKYRKKAEESLHLPENYFADSRKSLLDIAKTAREEKTTVRPLWVREHISWYIAVAAALVLGLFFLYNDSTPQPVLDPKEPIIDVATLTEDQIEQYLLEEYDYSLDDPAIINEVNFVNLPEEEWKNVSDEEINHSLEKDMDETILYQML